MTLRRARSRCARCDKTATLKGPTGTPLCRACTDHYYKVLEELIQCRVDKDGNVTWKEPTRG